MRSHITLMVSELKALSCLLEDEELTQRAGAL